MATPRRITLQEYLGIVDKNRPEEGEDGAPCARAGVLVNQKKWWDLFYRRNEDRFFKDRFWTFEEFPELSRTEEELVLFEAGCGVGNFVVPLMSVNSKLKMFACDISDNAINLLKKAPHYDETRCSAFQFDLLSPSGELHRHIAPSSVDVATLVFVLSAIPPEEGNMERVLRNVLSVLKPGGLLLFRDYAAGDYAQKRFEDAGSSKKPLVGCDKCFVRRDNTLSYFFTTQEIDHLFDQCGYDRVSSFVVDRETTNRKEGVTFKRKFIQGRYRRTLLADNNSESS